MYLLTKYKESIRWSVAVRLSYVYDAWCIKVNYMFQIAQLEIYLGLLVIELYFFH